MNAQVKGVLRDVNRSVVRYRGFYARWAALHRLNYHELLVLYTINESGYCTQKQLCDDYLLPRQTIHNAISRMRRASILCVSPEHSRGHEKAFILTESGRQYAEPLMRDLAAVENTAIETLGPDNLKQLAELLDSYRNALRNALRSKEQGDHPL